MSRWRCTAWTQFWKLIWCIVKTKKAFATTLQVNLHARWTHEQRVAIVSLHQFVRGSFGESQNEKVNCDSSDVNPRAFALRFSQWRIEICFNLKFDQGSQTVSDKWAMPKVNLDCLNLFLSTVLRTSKLKIRMPHVVCTFRNAISYGTRRVIEFNASRCGKQLVRTRIVFLDLRFDEMLKLRNWQSMLAIASA